MSKNYFSIRIDKENRQLITYLKEKLRAKVMILSSSIIYAEAENEDTNFENNIINLDRKAFNIIEVKKIIGNEYQNNEEDFEIIDKKECEDYSNLTQKKEMNIFELINDKIFEKRVDNLNKKKKPVRDAFEIIISKNYILYFTFLCLAFISIMKSLSLF